MNLLRSRSRRTHRQLILHRSFVSESLESRTLLSVGLTTLATFTGVPAATPVIDSTGNIYITETDGKTDGYGRIIKVAAGTNKVTTLLSFSAATPQYGTNPLGLTIDAAGNMYGATQGGIFELSAGTYQYTSLTGGSPGGPPVVAGGKIYYPADGPGANVGSIPLPASQTDVVAASSTQLAGDATPADTFSDIGAGFYAQGLVADSNGIVSYVTNGGANYGSEGAVNGTSGILFDGANGDNPEGTLTVDSANNVYGSTGGGGANDKGTIFEVPDQTDTLDTLVNLTSTIPLHLISDSVGDLFGMGLYHYGDQSSPSSLFELPTGSDTPVMLNVTGLPKNTLLVQGLAHDKSGTLYGVMQENGSSTASVFKLEGTDFKVTGSAILRTKLVVTQQPTSAVAGTILPTISGEVEDTLSGQMLGAAIEHVNLAIKSGPSGAILSGLTNIPFENNVATFSDVGVDLPGAYTLELSDSADSPATISLSVTSRPVESTISFAPAVISTGNNLAGIQVSDLGNGHLDEVVATDGGGAGGITVALGNGDGTFAGGDGEEALPVPSDFAIADLGNGNKDVIFTSETGNEVGVFIGDGQGYLESQPTLYPAGTGPVFLAVADLGNGHPHIIVSNYNGSSISVLLGHGDGTFAPAISYAAGDDPTSLTVTDLGNGHPDVIVANSSPSDNTVAVLIGNGNGTFKPAKFYTTELDPESIAVVDLGNHHDDLVVGSLTQNAVSVLTGSGDGTFGPAKDYFTGNAPTGVTVTALGNGQPDLVVVNSMDSTIAVCLGNGAGGFVAPQTYPAASASAPLAVTDLGNGHPDIVSVDVNGEISVLPGNGDGTFGSEQTFAAGTSPVSITVADLGNGYPDLIVADGDGGSAILIGNPSATIEPKQLDFTQSPAGGVTGVAIAPPIKVSEEDSSGNVVTSATGSVTLAINTGPTNAVLGGTLTEPFVNGVATFGDVTISDTGSYSLIATDATDSPAISGDITVASTQLVVTQPPLDTIVGQTLSPVLVRDEDALGRVVTTAAGSVTISLSSSTGALTGTLTQPFLNGAATFTDLKISAAGSYSLIATDGIDAAGSSAVFNVYDSTLTPAIASSTLPATMVTGSTVHGKVVVQLTNTAASISTGTTTIAIFASTNAAIDSSSVLLRTIKFRLKIKGGRTAAFAVPIKLPPSLSGNYSLLAKVTDPTGKTAVSNSQIKVTASAPFVSLSPAPISTRQSRAGTRIVSFILTNNGNVTSVGFTTITLYASTDNTVASGAAVYSRRQRLPVRPGSSKVVRVHLTAAQCSQITTMGMLVIQIVDPAGNGSTAALGI